MNHFSLLSLTWQIFTMRAKVSVHQSWIKSLSLPLTKESRKEVKFRIVLSSTTPQNVIFS